MNIQVLLMLIKALQEAYHKQQAANGYRGELMPSGEYMTPKGRILPTDQGGLLPELQPEYRRPMMPPMLNRPGFQPQPYGQMPPEKQINV